MTDSELSGAVSLINDELEASFEDKSILDVSFNDLYQSMETTTYYDCHDNGTPLAQFKDQLREAYCQLVSKA